MLYWGLAPELAGGAERFVHVVLAVDEDRFFVEGGRR
jgi:hypothetical protein